MTQHKIWVLITHNKTYQELTVQEGIRFRLLTWAMISDVKTNRKNKKKMGAAKVVENRPKYETNLIWWQNNLNGHLNFIDLKKHIMKIFD